MNNIYLKSYIRCKRKAWLDLNGIKSLKNWSPHKAIENINRYKTFFNLYEGNLYSGLKACERGCRGVMGLKIKKNLLHNIQTEVQPQLLVKKNGKSKWGPYIYIPAVYKLGHRTTKEHLFELTICAIFLETFQESKIDKGLVISNNGNKNNIEEIYLNKKLRKKVINVFFNMIESLSGSIPRITEDRKKCTICTWQNFCDKEAKNDANLTDIDGIGSKTALWLNSNGISNFKELSSYNKKELAEKLSQFNSQNNEKASKFIKQAQSYVSGKPIKIFEDNSLSNLLKLKDSGFFIFDIESNPDEKHDFLYGFLEINNLFDEIEDIVYKPILNIKKQNRESHELIINKFFSKKNWPVLHYGETEKMAIILLAKKLNYDTKEIEFLRSRFIDLHELVRKSWILPIKNYSLKTVANWLGFEWQQKNVSGSKALYWWIQFQISKNDLFLKNIIRYNKDDCLATLFIARWLITQKNIKENLIL